MHLSWKISLAICENQKSIGPRVRRVVGNESETFAMEMKWHEGRPHCGQKNGISRVES